MPSKELVRGLRSQIADRLRDDILSGRIEPGEKLAEPQLIKRFGVSRAPIREALVQLTQEGLLVGQANRGVRVTQPVPSELRELFLPIRRMLEVYALKKCFSSLTEKDFKVWEEILQRLKTACKARDFLASAEGDIAFHRTLVELAGQPDLVLIWSALVGRLREYFRQGHMSYPDPISIYEEHRAVLKAFRSGDLNCALAALRGNVGDVNSNGHR